MRILSFVVFLLLIGVLALSGLYPAYSSNISFKNDSESSQTVIIASGPAPTVQRESYWLDVRWPVDDYEAQSSDFGYRLLSNCDKCSRFHQGLDFVPGHGEFVYAAMDGVVVDAGWDGSFGYRVVLRHIIHPGALEYTTIYAHLQDSIITNRLQSNTKISKGSVIGLVGNTGVSTGSHLHFEVHENDKVLDPHDFYEFNLK